MLISATNVLVVFPQALEGFPSSSTKDIYRDTLLNGHFYYRVRMQAAQSLAKVRVTRLTINVCSVCVLCESISNGNCQLT